MKKNLLELIKEKTKADLGRISKEINLVNNE